MNKQKIYGKVAKGEPYRKAGARLTEDAEDVQKRTKLGDASQQLREYDIYHRFDKAHVVMLAEEGFHSGKDAKTILEALRRMEAAGITETRAETEAGEHSGEAWLITEIGEEIGGRIHAGRSSGDFMAVTSRIFIREFLLKLMAASIELRRVLLQLAEEHIDTVMPGSTWSRWGSRPGAAAGSIWPSVGVASQRLCRVTSMPSRSARKRTVTPGRSAVT